MHASTAASYEHGVSLEPLLGRTLGEHFRLISQRYPGNRAVVSRHQRLSLTYAELSDRVDHFARGLMRLGIQAGERVGIWSTNNLEWVITQLATARIGAILVNINPAYRHSELEYALRQSGVKMLVMLPGFRDQEYLDMAESLISNKRQDGFLVESEVLPELRHYAVIGSKSESRGYITFEEICRLSSALPAEELEQRAQGLQFDDPINIQYTSGTTGFPKGVTLSHHNLLNNALSGADAMGIDDQSRYCVPMPFYHCGGMVIGTLSVLLKGGTLVIPSASFDAAATLEAIEADKCTHLCGVPTMFIAELDLLRTQKWDTSSLRSGFMAGAPCPVALMRQVASDMHLEDLIIIYGQTECSPIITCTTAQDSQEKRVSTVGKVIPHLEVKVVDAMTGHTVARNVQGEICARGYAVMLGYWMNSQATAEAIDQAGWLHTGDLGVMHEDGYINITGRKKDMIIRGGENIYPREIEEVLHHHPAIASAQVFGVPDARLGEEVALWLKLRHGARLSEKEIIDWLKERVAYFKVPKHVRVVTEFPMTVTGKIQKYMMRQVMIEELGLAEAANVETA